MRFKKKIKMCWQGSEETAELAALLSIPIFIPIMALMFALYFDWYEKNTLNLLKTGLVVITLVLSTLIIFKFIHLIINYFYHSINHDFLQNKLDSEKNKIVQMGLFFIPLSILALFELGRLFSFFSNNAKVEPIKAAMIYFGIAFIGIVIFIFRKSIGKFFREASNNINGFLFSKDEIKAVPILLTITTVSIFILLIKASYTAHFLKNSISDDITYLVMGMVFVPFVVYITSGTLIYRTYERIQDSNRINVLLKLCTIISRIILILVFTIIVVLVFIADFRIDYGHGIVLFLYISFTSLQIKKLINDFYYLKSYKS